MNKILPLIIILVAIGGSGFAAMTLRGGGEAEAESAHAGGKVLKPGEAGHGGEKKAASSAFFEFQRDFIVPVMRSGVVDSVVLVRLTLEAPEEKVETMRSREPKIRDAMMKTLLTLSHEGPLKGDITDPEVYTEIQSRLLATAQEVADNEVKAVLIVDFARQDS
jgi:flagellar basal body-associated protein FliL